MKASFLSLAAAMSVACAHAAVILNSGDAAGEHSFDTAGYWSSGAAPTSGNDYLVALGAGAYLRGPTTVITASAQAQTITFAGDSLTIGVADTPGEMYVTHAGYATLEIPDLRLVNGTIRAASNENTYYYANDGKKQRITGTATVTSTTNNPFTFAPMGNANHSGIHLSANLVGDETAAIRVLSENASGSTSGAWIHLSIAGDNSKYHGRFIVEGGSARFWPGWCSCSDTTFGATPETFMKDCIILRNGGGLHTEISTAFTLKAPNRGIWIEGSGSFGSQGSYTIAMPIGGGALSVEPHQNACITLAAPLTCSKISIGNGACNLTAAATIGDEVSCIQINGNGAFGSSCDRTVKIRYNGSGRSGFYYSGSQMATKLPVYTLTDDSEWLEGKNTCFLRISAANVPFGRGAPEWIPVLKVPITVKDLAGVTFTVADGSGTGPRSYGRVKVELDSATGMQTVSVGQDYYYMVNANNRPSGHAAQWPYNTWKTAATELYTVITTAMSRAGGVIYVGEGTYNISSPITIFNQTKIGSSTRTTPYVIAGVNFNTMEPSPEKVIFDGGYPARSNLIFTISTLGSCAIRDVTIQHGGRYNASDGNFGGGGAIYAQSMAMSSYVDGCRFLNNFSHHGGVAQASGGIWTNCYFKGNKSSNGSGVFVNPQGSADKNGNYLTIACCTFEENVDLNGGAWGGCSVIGSGRNGRIYGSTFRRNGSTSNAGASLISFSYFGELHDCVFEDNIGHISLSDRYQGFWHMQVPMTNLVFRGNTTSNTLLAPSHNVYTEPNVNISFVSNTCSTLMTVAQGLRQGAAYGNTCSTRLFTINTNCREAREIVLENMTVVSNTTPVVLTLPAKASDPVTVTGFTILNSIVWANHTSAGVLSDCSITSGLLPTLVTHTCYDTPSLVLYADSTCLTGNPRLDANYRLTVLSRCRDVGLNQPWMEGALDLDGHPRLLNRNGKMSDSAVVDLGAYECNLAAPGFVVIYR